nr:hypothetical protein [Tanacetum cinerariifolium]
MRCTILESRRLSFTTSCQRILRFPGETRKTRSSSDTSITPRTAAASPRQTTSAKGKQTTKSSKAKSLSALSEVAMTKAQQMKLVTKRSMQQTHISQPSSSGADEGTGSKSGVPDVPTEESEEELSWNSTDDEGDDNEEKDDDEANIALIEEWDDIQAKIDAEHQLAERLPAQEQEELSDAEKATLFQQLLEKRRKHFAAKEQKMQYVQIYMLVEKKYPRTPPTLSMMLEKKLQIDYESEMAYQLCKLIKKWLKKIVGIKSLLDAVGITAAHLCVNTALMKLVLLMNFKENMPSSYYCCNLFQYGETQEETVILRTFPYLLSGEAKTWLNELDEGTITSFHQLAHETLVEAWLRLKEMFRTYYGHGLTKGTIIQIFYRGLDDPTQRILDAEGIFLYKTPNEAFKILEDKDLLKLDFLNDF